MYCIEGFITVVYSVEIRTIWVVINCKLATQNITVGKRTAFYEAAFRLVSPENFCYTFIRISCQLYKRQMSANESRSFSAWASVLCFRSFASQNLALRPIFFQLRKDSDIKTQTTVMCQSFVLFSIRRVLWIESQLTIAFSQSRCS